MGAFFESALLFSLAVLIILIGLLIYYFKGRITDLEQKNVKCLELIGDVYKSHLELKRNSSCMIPPQMFVGGGVQEEPRIKIELEEHDQNRQYINYECDDEDDDESEDDESEDESEDESDDDESRDNTESAMDIKTVNVNFDSGIDSGIEIIDLDTTAIEENDDDDKTEPIEIEEIDQIIVNKLDTTDGEEYKQNDQQPTNMSRESYKKMSLPALRGFIISNGYQTDNAKLQKMKKNELIDLIIESSSALA